MSKGRPPPQVTQFVLVVVQVKQFVLQGKQLPAFRYLSEGQVWQLFEAAPLHVRHEAWQLVQVLPETNWFELQAATQVLGAPGCSRGGDEHVRQFKAEPEQVWQLPLHWRQSPPDR